MTQPTKPLTRRQDEVAALLGKGWPNKRIAAALFIEIDTVDSHIEQIALRLPNPDDLPARTLVMLWAAHRLWLTMHRPAA